MSTLYVPSIVPELALAERRVRVSRGVTVSVDAKAKELDKFGRNDAVGTDSGRYTLGYFGGSAQQQHETYVNTNAITTISSDNANDDQVIQIEYHTIDGNGDFTFGVQQATLDGTSQVSLPVACARVSRAFNAGSTALQGNVYIYENDTNNDDAGVPDTDTGVHLVILLGDEQSFKAATTISKNDYFFPSLLKGTILEKVSAFADIRLEVREKGGIFRPREKVAVNSTGSSTASVSLEPSLVVPANSDIRLTAIASGTGISVGGSINGHLASVLS